LKTLLILILFSKTLLFIARNISFSVGLSLEFDICFVETTGGTTVCFVLTTGGTTIVLTSPLGLILKKVKGLSSAFLAFSFISPSCLIQGSFKIFFVVFKNGSSEGFFITFSGPKV
jgi:hypothetical protein